jgi:hypothetical protein
VSNEIQVEEIEDDGWTYFGSVYQHRHLLFQMRVVGFTMEADADRNMCETLESGEGYAITQKTLREDYVLVWRPPTEDACKICGKEGEDKWYKREVDDGKAFFILCQDCHEKGLLE